jgi:hypothetical protein
MLPLSPTARTYMQRLFPLNRSALLVFNCMVGALLGAAVRPWYMARTHSNKLLMDASLYYARIRPVFANFDIWG